MLQAMIAVMKDTISQVHMRTAGPPVIKPVMMSPVREDTTATAVRQKLKFMNAVKPRYRVGSYPNFFRILSSSFSISKFFGFSSDFSMF